MRQTTTYLALLTAIFMAGSAVLLAEKQAEAAFPGINGSIAFADDSGAASGTYTVDPAGGEPVRIGDTASELAYSPDGTKIAFTFTPDGRDEEVWMMDADGTNRVQLTDFAGSNRDPAWYPAGRRLAVERSRSQREGAPGTDVYALRLNAARDRVVGAERLTGRSGFDGDPAVSPNGKRLAFVSGRDGRSASIYVMGANTPEGPRNAPKQVAGINSGGRSDPDWSPDGKRIVYEGYADFFSNIDEWFEAGVYSTSSDGRRERLLVDLGEWGDHFDADPVYSPDGTQIAYSNIGDVWRMNPDGTGQTRVTAAGVSARYPSWQPLP